MTTASVTSIFLKRTLQEVLRTNKKAILKHFTKHAYISEQLPMREFEEIKFKVPWGHISGKWYGPKNTRPIVGFHGVQDNCGTFDPIAPMLPSHVGFLAVDLPGHGLSSWLPDGCGYHTIDFVQFMLILMREFKWDKISMICHSMSCMNGFIFNSLFPDKCDMFIAIDILKPIMPPKNFTIKSAAKRLEEFHTACQKNESKLEPPCYVFDELVERLHEASETSIEKESCQFILKRHIKPSLKEPNKFYFNIDRRLRSILFYFLPQDVVLEMASRISCPHLFIKASQGPYYENKANFDEVLHLLLQKPTFEFHQVDGKHHVHLNEPRKIADIINPFINKYRPK